jgi:DNA-directed RNA polymerase subunit H
MEAKNLATKKIPVLVPNHVYVPKHEILNITDAQKVLKTYNCNPTDLPFIFVSDPAIVGLGVKPGDMIKITRKSGTAGVSIYYRYVVEEGGKK